ncbi:hypothetical protein PO909_032555 [Leuciscus waleckii]
MKTACLQTSYFPQDHTGEHIAEALQDALTKLNEKELVAIMTDNGSNVIKGMELQKWLRMQCSLVTDAISLCNKVVSSFSYSWRKRRELAEVQIQLGLPAHQLITESATRWGSRQQKSRHLAPTWQDIEVLESIQKALKPLQDITDALSGEEYVTISYVRPVLHLFNKSPGT